MCQWSPGGLLQHELGGTNDARTDESALLKPVLFQCNPLKPQAEGKVKHGTQGVASSKCAVMSQPLPLQRPTPV
jgi:hypothetical protein